jgi:hypothetical protein
MRPQNSERVKGDRRETFQAIGPETKVRATSIKGDKNGDKEGTVPDGGTRRQTE